jgi:hypothetical protein
MAVPVPEISAASIVVIGEFPPVVFRPDWFVQNELLDQEEVDSGTIDVVSPDLTAFTTSWLTFAADRQRLQLVVRTEPLVRIYDLALGLIPHFAETPVQALGINRDVHVKMGTEEAWLRLGDMLAPKDFWPPELIEPDIRSRKSPRWGAGLRALVMERMRDTPPGHTHMRIEPSLAIGPFGVFFGSNDHYALQTDLTAPAIPASAAADLIATHWKHSMTFADLVRTKILEKVR